MRTLGGIPVEVGDILAKKYRVERLVAEGGTGVVVSAKHLQLDQRVAIKFLRTALASDEVRVRFEREARAISRIQSEHVVLVLDVGTLPDGEPFMVQEYLDGRDLARVLKEDGPLSVEDAVDCVLQICEALSEAHAAGIVHRDLKPANLFLTLREDGGPHVKVVDFGISKILDKGILRDERGSREMTGAFEVLGSPRYMAPEQLRNSKDVDHRADLWSVGAVLFQLVTGQHAFEADSNVHASLVVMTGEPRRLCDLAPHAPKELEAIVARCLTKDVTERWQSAKELATALLPFASDRTRHSLELLERAKEAPSLSIALGVSTLVSRAGTDAPPRAPARPHGASPREAPATSTHAPPTAPAAFRPASLPPPSVDGGSVASVRSAPEPSTAVKIAVVAGGVIAVLIVFGLLTGAKLAARSFGLIPPAASGEPTSAARPKLAFTARRPDPVSVPLDAGTIAP